MKDLNLVTAEGRGKLTDGVGTAITDYMTPKEAIVEGGLDWEVETEPIMVAPKHDAQGHFLGGAKPIDFKKAIVRQSDRKVLSVVGTTYKPVQNKTAFDFASGIVASDGNMIERVGDFDDGKTVFLSIALKAVEPIKINGDPSADFETFLVLSNSHDGTSALRGTITPVLIRCWNTYTLAFSGSDNKFSIRHSGDVEGKMQAARDALGITIDYMRRFEHVAERLIDTPVSDDKAADLMKDIFEMGDEIEAQEDTEWYAKHHATKSLELLMSSPTIPDELRNTGWGVVNAVSEYLDHARVYGKATDRDAGAVKATSVLWGPGNKVLNRTAALLVPESMDAKAVRAARKVAKRSKVAA